MSSDARFWDRMAKFYRKQKVKDEEAFQVKLATTQEYFQPDMRVLEIGCGTGSRAVAHAPHVAHYTATDFSGRMIDFAKSRVEEAGLENVTLACADIDAATAESNRYDVVIAASLLHLLENPEEGIRQCAGALTPSGYFVSTTPCLAGKLGLMGPVIRIAGRLGLVPKTVQEFSEEQLLGWISSAGLKVVHHWRPEGGEAVYIVAKAS